MPHPRYRQCTLINGAAIQVSWLPEKYAILGKKLRLRKSHELWLVVEVFGHSITDEAMQKIRRDVHAYQAPTGREARSGFPVSRKEQDP